MHQHISNFIQKHDFIAIYLSHHTNVRTILHLLFTRPSPLWGKSNLAIMDVNCSCPMYYTPAGAWLISQTVLMRTYLPPVKELCTAWWVNVKSSKPPKTTGHPIHRSRNIDPLPMLHIAAASRALHDLPGKGRSLSSRLPRSFSAN